MATVPRQLHLCGLSLNLDKSGFLITVIHPAPKVDSVLKQATCEEFIFAERIDDMPCQHNRPLPGDTRAEDEHANIKFGRFDHLVRHQ